jgi:hypothetical protein
MSVRGMAVLLATLAAVYPWPPHSTSSVVCTSCLHKHGECACYQAQTCTLRPLGHFLASPKRPCTLCYLCGENTQRRTMESINQAAPC